MKKTLAILFVSILFVSVSALAVMFFDDTSPDPKACKTCVYKAVVQ